MCFLLLHTSKGGVGSAAFLNSAELSADKGPHRGHSATRNAEPHVQWPVRGLPLRSTEAARTSAMGRSCQASVINISGGLRPFAALGMNGCFSTTLVTALKSPLRGAPPFN